MAEKTKIERLKDFLRYKKVKNPTYDDFKDYNQRNHSSAENKLVHYSMAYIGYHDKNESVLPYASAPSVVQDYVANAFKRLYGDQNFVFGKVKNESTPDIIEALDFAYVKSVYAGIHDEKKENFLNEAVIFADSLNDSVHAICTRNLKNYLNVPSNQREFTVVVKNGDEEKNVTIQNFNDVAYHFGQGYTLCGDASRLNEEFQAIIAWENSFKQMNEDNRDFVNGYRNDKDFTLVRENPNNLTKDAFEKRVEDLKKDFVDAVKAKYEAEEGGTNLRVIDRFGNLVIKVDVKVNGFKDLEKLVFNKNCELDNKILMDQYKKLLDWEAKSREAFANGAKKVPQMDTEPGIERETIGSWILRCRGDKDTKINSEDLRDNNTKRRSHLINWKDLKVMASHNKKSLKCSSVWKMSAIFGVIIGGASAVWSKLKFDKTSASLKEEISETAKEQANIGLSPEAISYNAAFEQQETLLNVTEELAKLPEEDFAILKNGGTIEQIFSTRMTDKYGSNYAEQLSNMVTTNEKGYDQYFRQVAGDGALRITDLVGSENTEVYSKIKNGQILIEVQNNGVEVDLSKNEEFAEFMTQVNKAYAEGQGSLTIPSGSAAMMADNIILTNKYASFESAQQTLTEISNSMNTNNLTETMNAVSDNVAVTGEALHDKENWLSSYMDALHGKLDNLGTDTVFDWTTTTATGMLLGAGAGIGLRLGLFFVALNKWRSSARTANAIDAINAENAIEQIEHSDDGRTHTRNA